MQRLWISGYRSYELNVFDQNDPKIKVIKTALRQRLIAQLNDQQLDWIITGGNLGVEQWAIQTALDLKKDYQLKVALMIPYQNFADRWNESNQAIYADLRDRVDYSASTSNQNYQNFTQLQNFERFMLAHTDKALFVYDPEHEGKPTYDYKFIQNCQKSRPYDLNLINFYDLEDVAEVMNQQREL